MSRLASALTIFLFLAAAVIAVSGCAGVNQKSPSQEVKAFFVAGSEAKYMALQCPSSGYADLSAYTHLMGIKYPRTFQVDVLRQPPSRPYQAFAVLECEPAPQGQSQELMAGLKDKAMEIGADAIILCHGPELGLPGIPPTPKMQAVAIKYIMTRTSDKGKS